MTRLDGAYAGLASDPDSREARSKYLGILAETELFVRLVSEIDGEDIEPELIETSAGEFALAFDSAERFARESAVAQPYAALPGRVLAELLSAESIGLAINVGTDAEMVMTSEELAWLVDQLSTSPEEATLDIAKASPPGNLPHQLLSALDAQLARAAGLARTAYLAEVSFKTGGKGHLLAVIDPAPGSEPAFARSIDNALRFSGLDAASLDVGFFSADDAVTERLSRVGLRFDIPKEEPHSRPAPESDPKTPPKLR